MTIKRLSRLVGSILISLLVIVLVATPVLAYLYRAPITITEANAVAYSMLPVVVASPNTWLATNGFMLPTALDTTVETLGGATKPHMVTNTTIWTAVPIPASSQTNLYLTTGNSPGIPSMDIIVGYNGHIATSEAVALRLGDKFSVEVDGWVDTSAVGNGLLTWKSGSFTTLVSAANTITTGMCVGTTAPNSFTDASGNWATEGQAYNGNVADYASHTGGVADTWLDFLELTPAAPIWTDSVNYHAWYDATIADQIDIDVFYAAAWHDVYAGVFANATWETKILGGVYYVENVRIRFHWNVAGASWGAGQNSRLNELSLTSYTIATTVTPVASGEHTVKSYCDGAWLMLSLDSDTSWDGIHSNRVASGGALCAVSTADWVINANNALSYMSYYKHYVDVGAGLVLIAHYQPVTMISGTTLPDVVAPAQNGTFTFGTNPAGITVTLGGMVSSSQPSAGTDEEIVPIDTLPDVEVSDWFAEPDVSVKLLNNPLRPMVTMVSDNTTLTEIQTWRLYGVIFVLFVLILTAVNVNGHYLITGIGTGVAIGICVAMTVFPLWALVFMIGAVLGGIIAERSPSL